MAAYIGRRIIQSLVILLGVTVIVFTLVNLIPGNPWLSMLPPDAPPEQVEQLLLRAGYYDPLPIKYLKWLGELVKGNAGYSIFYRESVMSIIASRMGNTILLTVTSIGVSIILGISVGIISARRRKSGLDNTVSILSFVIISLPSFFFGMLLIKVFGSDLRLLPISGKVTVWANYQGLAGFLDVAAHMVMPTVVLGLANAAMMLRYTRSAVCRILDSDYIRAARAHGISERAILFRHILVNILIPIVTVLSLQIPDLLSGALLTETVFSWPGVGRLSFEAVRHRDYPLVMGILLVMTVITLSANLLADISYALIDRRITVTGESDG